jgi:hypothetical protein
MRYPNLDVAARVQYINSVFIGPIRRATAKNFEHEPLSETKTKAMSYFGAKLTLQIVRSSRTLPHMATTSHRQRLQGRREALPLTETLARLS